MKIWGDEFRTAFSSEVCNQRWRALLQAEERKGTLKN